MKEPFLVVNKESLEKYFSEYLIPKLKQGDLSKDKVDGVYLRELLGLVVLAYLLTYLNKEKYSIGIDNNSYDDGVVVKLSNNTFIPVEQTYVYEGKWDNNVLSGINDVIFKKHEKGKAYADNVWLLIFCNSVGEFKPNEVQNLLKSIHFQSVLAFGPTGKNEFGYFISLLKDGGAIQTELFELIIEETGKFEVISM